jgi:hypothetical protein
VGDQAWAAGSMAGEASTVAAGTEAVAEGSSRFIAISAVSGNWSSFQVIAQRN